MLKKRLMGVVTVKDGWAVQSFGYRRYLPLGKPECLIENLDRWGADEILVQVIDRSRCNREPDFRLLESIGKLGLATPLIYAGGIRNVADSVKVIQYGADRLVVDALLHDDLQAVQHLSARLGAQAIIASLPLSWQEGRIEWFDYRTQTRTAIANQVLSFISSGVVSEVFISDFSHEGQANGFESNLITNFPLQDVPIVAFGGLSDPNQIRNLLLQPNIVAIAVGNFLNYKEQTIQTYKQAISSAQLRNPVYDSSHSLLTHA
ncbi:HisA/HisF-related TIM barrel protein [Pseudanabaena sp. BC1403]|uniref:HisA/HisF-related TIM barrel protein n=1 Tax=Pseudanabaena sp. BC1403 TaxID=2043171 RepID=UPI000CD81324|nr:HisA/HisF-related TIM barrel protein [Pseudanabaena sp. BC1403]